MLDQGADKGQVGQVQQEVKDALASAAQEILASMQSMRNAGQGQSKQPGQTAGSAGTGSSGSKDLSGESLPEAAMLLSEDWGKLPGEVKNQILQAMSEGYPKEFEKMIQVYFKGLAEADEQNETN